ncbi:MAG: ribosome small subunit-dependent GTPase A [Actinobacteria bacterium]|jgi:ribosome biogenesis GTPase|nr:ribosome small subunit-dependent GTPase A [Actinomycetota bacterium]
MTRRQLDEDDVRIRPGRTGARARTKDRPTHENAVDARVLVVDRGRMTCALDETGEKFFAMKARELGRKGIVVGDRVGVVGDITGDEGSLARIVRRHERTTTLNRSADDVDPTERVIVANADTLVMVVALANPEPRPGLINRCLVAAFTSGMTPILVATKADLASADDLRRRYQPLGVEMWATTRGEDVNALRDRLHGHIAVMVGHSGVGKSTLINGLAPNSHRRTGEVNDVTGRGRHTSTSAEAIRTDDGYLIDTPGIRSFGLAHVNSDDVVHAFPALAEGLDECPRGCSHDEAECGLDAFVAAGRAGEHGDQLLESVRGLIRSISAGERFD